LGRGGCEEEAAAVPPCAMGGWSGNNRGVYKASIAFSQRNLNPIVVYDDNGVIE
jgi:hypothetical protein